MANLIQQPSSTVGTVAFAGALTVLLSGAVSHWLPMSAEQISATTVVISYLLQHMTGKQEQGVSP